MHRLPNNTIYIAGPMQGYAHYNRPAFDAAEKRWEESGWRVVNPHDIDNPAPHEKNPAVQHAAWMRQDLLALLIQCDAMALLPGWDNGRSAAMVEAIVADAVGCEFYDAVTMRRLSNSEVQVQFVKWQGSYLQKAN